MPDPAPAHDVGGRAATRTLREIVGERLASSDLTVGPRSLIETVLANVDAPSVADTGMPVDVYLTSLSVEGFRGIGTKVSVPLRAGPGLTVITGRNGSGKSSLAESIELLLTGDNARWADKKSGDLRKGWKNLHHAGATQIEVELSARGTSMMTLSRQWSGNDLADGVSMVKRPGKDPVPLASLGWAQALLTYRPFLSYGELGGLIEDGPSRLHDAIANILGLEEFTAVKDALSARKSALKAQAKSSKDAWTLLADALKASPDLRAAAIVTVSAKRGWTAAQVEALLVDDNTGDDTVSGWCRSIEAIPPLAGTAVKGCVDAFSRAAEAVAAFRGSDAEAALATATLLEQAIALHRSSQVADCPVCGTEDVLDDAWLKRAEADVSRLQADAAAAREAARQLAAAERDLRQSLPAVPAVLGQRPDGLDESVASAAALLHGEWASSVTTFRSASAGELAERASAIKADLAAALDGLKVDASTVLKAADGDWTPLARRVRAWCDQAVVLGDADVALKDTTAAETWVDALIDEFREQRLAPIRSAVESVWNDLRCDSNITLSNFELDGRGNRRRVNLELSVDDTPAPSLGVLSQGEMHALALSLFLPRAALDESPFRFLVIDDPVQAMDPSKVDGLARQLAKVAATRQVIVLTHDDRLPEAVRRLGIDARVSEVLRGAKSSVRVEKRIDPTERCLMAARDLSKDMKLPVDIARQVIASQCRQALEAECVDLIQTRMIRAGTRMVAIDAALEKAKTLNDLLSLLVLNDVSRAGEAGMLLESEMRGARELIRVLQSGTHGSVTSLDTAALVADTRKLVKALQRKEAT